MVISFLADFSLTFIAEKPPPSHVFIEGAFVAIERGAEYF
jgi:hypothetical protein